MPGSLSAGTSAPTSSFIDGLTGPAELVAARAASPRTAASAAAKRARAASAIVLALEEAEERRPVVVDPVVLVVDDRGDPSDDAAVPPREEELPLRVLPERVLRRVEHPADVAPKGRRPVRIARVEAERQLDEVAKVRRET